MKTDTIIDFLAHRHSELLNLTKELIAIPSENPPGDETRMVEFLECVLECQVPEGNLCRLSAHPSRPNLIASYRFGPGPTLLLGGHTDTKPSGDLTKWDSDPFAGEIRDNRLYGLGAADMKASLAAMIIALKALKSLNIQLKGEIILGFFADEEMGSKFGSQYVVTKGLRADAAILGEPAGNFEPLEGLMLTCRGGAQMKVIVRGTQGHSSLSDLQPTVNASVMMAQLLSDLRKEMTFDFSKNQLYPQGITANWGAWVRAGHGYGITPGIAEFGTDLRIPPGITLDEVITPIRHWILSKQLANPELDAELQVESYNPGAQISASHPVITAISKAWERVMGKPMLHLGMPCGTDANVLFNRAAIPTVPGLGPGALIQCHVQNEWVDTNAILCIAQIYALTALFYLR